MPSLRLPTRNAPQTLNLRNRFPRTSPPQKRSRPPIMLDPAEAIGKARAAVTERAELPGMSLMEHLDELRRRIVHSAIYLGLGFLAVWSFHNRFVDFIQAPLNHIGKSLVFTHPMDALNLDLQVSLVGGAILSSPFVLYQVWLFIAPGL